MGLGEWKRAKETSVAFKHAGMSLEVEFKHNVDPILALNIRY